VEDLCGFPPLFALFAQRHLHPHTLESKVCPHLFFAGEVCDVDAITGGFNLQAAWTMGHVVGRHIVD